jgi:NAD(P)-dependent dehydrogenase (short-subunit alcohol dehydrogenase family)
MLLKDKVVIVTGAARGIGKAYTQTVEEIRKGGGEAIYIHADVADEQSVEGLAKVANSHYGRIDGLVNNAAIFANLRYASFDKITVEEWDAVMSVNVKGVWLASKAVYPYMKGRSSGKIINIASGVPFKGSPVFAHYTVSKGAVVTLTRVLARAMGKDGICVNAVAPGLTRSDSLTEARGELLEQDDAMQIKTRAIPRSELPEDLIGAVVFFLSDAANFITGQPLLVDGGSHMN